MDITQQYLGHQNVKNAVIAVPAKFNEKQRAATRKAFQNAGVTVTRVLEEPVAAALAYGLQKKSNVDFIMVYDFGGGTLDVSILQVSEGGYVEVMGSDGDNQLGGADFDAAIAHFLLDHNDGRGVIERVVDALHSVRRTLQIEEDDLEQMLETDCAILQSLPLCSLSSYHTIGEQMKIELSSLSTKDEIVVGKCLSISHDVAMPETIFDFCSKLQPMNLQLSLGQFETTCNPLFQRAMHPIKRILADMNVETDEIDEVVMVGGTTRMPQIREMIKKELNIKELNTHIDPDLTVAYGAASVND